MRNLVGDFGELLRDSSYTCVGTFQDNCFRKSRNVEGITKNHMPRKNRLDVTMFSLVPNQKADPRSIPKRLGNFFPLLEALIWTGGSLTTINLKDLEQFPHLKELQLTKNKIKALPSNVFSNNPNIEFLAFDQNKIRSVGQIFKYLKKVKIMYVKKNFCTRKLSQVCGNNIQVLRKRLPLLCSVDRRSGSRNTPANETKVDEDPTKVPALSDEDDENSEENDEEDDNDQDIDEIDEDDYNDLDFDASNKCIDDYEKFSDIFKNADEDNGDGDDEIMGAKKNKVKGKNDKVASNPKSKGKTPTAANKDGNEEGGAVKPKGKEETTTDSDYFEESAWGGKVVADQISKKPVETLTTSHPDDEEDLDDKVTVKPKKKKSKSGR